MPSLLLGPATLGFAAAGNPYGSHATMDDNKFDTLLLFNAPGGSVHLVESVEVDSEHLVGPVGVGPEFLAVSTFSVDTFSLNVPGGSVCGCVLRPWMWLIAIGLTSSTQRSSQ